jgi:signal peptidase I
MLERIAEWRRSRRALKEARLLLREGKRAVRKYAHRLTPQAATAVREAIEALETALQARKANAAAEAQEAAAAQAQATGSSVSRATAPVQTTFTSELNALDKALDEYMPFARKSTLREYAESIAVAVLIALFLRAFVVEAFKIPSGSMIPTLEVGDHIFVNKFIYGIRIPFTNIKIGTGYRKPRRGEVIVFVYPVEPDKDFIKRIVAVEGDTVEVRDNILFVNDRPIQRMKAEGDCNYWEYIELEDRWEERACDRYVENMDGQEYSTIYDKGAAPRSSGPRTVPKDSVFVMGDNRLNSHDSRAWGFVPLVNIKGKAMVVWWSAGQPDGWIRLRRLFRLVE